MMMPNHPKSDFKASPRLSRFTNGILALVFNPSTPSLLCPRVTGGNSWWWNQSLVLMLIKTNTGISTFHKPMSKTFKTHCSSRRSRKPSFCGNQTQHQNTILTVVPWTKIWPMCVVWSSIPYWDGPHSVGIPKHSGGLSSFRNTPISYIVGCISHWYPIDSQYITTIPIRFPHDIRLFVGYIPISICAMVKTWCM